MLEGTTCVMAVSGERAEGGGEPPSPQLSAEGLGVDRPVVVQPDWRAVGVEDHVSLRRFAPWRRFYTSALRRRRCCWHWRRFVHRVHRRRKWSAEENWLNWLQRHTMPKNLDRGAPTLLPLPGENSWGWRAVAGLAVIDAFLAVRFSSLDVNDAGTT